MLSRLECWVRSGNFNFVEKAGGMTSRKVSYYYCTSRIVYVKTVELIANCDGFALCLSHSPFYKSELMSLAKKHFPIVRELSIQKGIEIEITNDFLQRFAQFSQANEILKSQFNKTIMMELKEVVLFMRHSLPFVEHRIPINKALTTMTTRSSQQKSRRLIALLESRVALNYVMLHELLVQGEHPNQVSAIGVSFLSRMNRVFNENLALFKLFLAYHAMYTYPDPCENLSPLEDACNEGLFNVVNCYIDLLSPVEKSVLAVNKLLSVTILAGKRCVKTSYCFPKGELYSTLKLATDVTPEELQGLHELYKQLFDGSQAGIAGFAPEKDKYIDIIRNEGGKVVGSVVYKIRKQNEKLWLNVDFALFDNRYSNYGAMAVMIFRFAYALQLLYPEQSIWLVFLAAHFNAFNYFKQQLVIPMYQPDGKVEEVIDVLKNLFGYKFKELRYEAPGLCYAIEEQAALVKGPAKSKSPCVHEALYQQFRGDRSTMDEDKAKQRDAIQFDEATLKERGVVVSLPITSTFLATLQQNAANKGINFYRVSADLAKEMQASGMFGQRNHQASPRFFAASELFWDDKQRVSEEFDHEAMSNEPQHRCNQANL